MDKVLAQTIALYKALHAYESALGIHCLVSGVRSYFDRASADANDCGDKASATEYRHVALAMGQAVKAAEEVEDENTTVEEL